MDVTDLQPIVAAALYDAVSYIDDDIGPDRAKALDYYFGRPFGDEEQGRSAVVSRDVHDMVQAALPSLMRIFFGPEHVVEFEPYGPEDVDEAEQKTDYVNYIITTDNDGFDVFYSAIKDALRSKVGVVKYWWDSSEEVTTETYTGLDEASLTVLLEDLSKARKAELISAEETDGGLSVRIKLTRKKDRVCIAALPPEEFIISRDAVSIDDAELVAHRSVKTVSDLVAMGYDRGIVEAGSGDDLDWNEERLARNPSIQEGSESVDPSLRRVLYTESFIRSDMDGDGIAELLKVCTVGSNYRIIHWEDADERPFADFHCDPEPHTFFGESLSDKTMDIQRSKSLLLRASHDALSQAIFPRTVVGRGGNIQDALNTEVGAILRAEGNVADAYMFQAVPDTSKTALPMLSYMDELRENRTGMSKVSMGLDAEALQNTTATAAEGNFTRSQERLELIARVMASGMRRLFRGVARLVTQNQRAERMVKLRNKWIPVDPRGWRADMNVICNVGLGGGSPEQKIQVLSMIAAKQESILQIAGMTNPLVTLKNYHTTLSKIVQEAGFKNPDAFFSDPEGEEAQQRMAQVQPQPDPKMVEAQAKMELEAQKSQAQIQFQQEKTAAELELERARMEMQSAFDEQKMAREFDFRREQAAAELQLKREEMMLEAQLKREANQLNAQAMASTNVDGPTQGGDPG